MKKRSDNQDQTVTSLIGLGNHSARKSYYPELVSKLDELEQEKNRYKWLFENAQHGIFQASLDGGISTANPAIVKICGYLSSDDFCHRVETVESSLFCCHDSYSVFRRNLIDYGRVFGFETLFRRADGQCVHVSINALLKTVEGEATTVEAFVQDITERKKTQERLKQLNEDLESRVESRTHELVALNDKLWKEISEREQIQKELKVAKEVAEEANKSKDKYLAAASHDLLQPMNAARLLIAALRERELHEQDAHLIERVHLALENAEDLLTDLLDISKLDQKAVNPDISEFRVYQLLASMVGEFQPVAESKGLHIKASFSSAVVKSDSRLLLRIIRNFISNAIRYTGDGKVLVGCRRKGDKLSIQVWDTGTGIPENKQQEIFKEFQQLDCHASQGRQGVGLGLAIVERISNMLGHQLKVSSIPGKGSMFSVEVPLVKNPVSVHTVTKFHQPIPDQLNRLAVLVIDNEENILVSMQALLEQWGCQVITALSEVEARELCQDEKFVPEVILADFHLDDDKLGTDAVLNLRESFGLDIPAVMLTADRSTECRQMFRQLGFPVLNKPVKPGKLRALLTHLA
ncbi:NahK/ErcS family hybrid sensor histidine kinase/response regulator [uncultured Neptuniibacter sp.]|uniref:PAS domain-containing hybrid sensor histidine kinase/response regulator n=1 Tax=uncultured Neptuniibacter sp. TaxID=502143 RepID=UPI00262B3ACB|nr:NahK/ErcS family hybrid sensor histidine kinase/response regulator [uncultured Neptuniibacter sp.]